MRRSGGRRSRIKEPPRSVRVGLLVAVLVLVIRLVVMVIGNLPRVNRLVIHLFGMLCGIVVVSLLLTVGMTSYWGIVGGVVVNSLNMGQ